MSKQFVITPYKDGYFSGIMDQKKLYSAHFFKDENESITGNIYLAKVINIVPNIHAAFLDIAPGKRVFLPIPENQNFITTNRVFDGKLKQQDTVIIQIEKDAVKTKDPFATGNLSLTGHYCVITLGKPGLAVSQKISDKQRSLLKERIKKELLLLNSDITNKYGIVIRTNVNSLFNICQSDDLNTHDTQFKIDVLMEEINFLVNQMEELIRTANYRTPYSILWKKEAPYIEFLKQGAIQTVDKIVTDVPDFYTNLKEYFKGNESVLDKLSLYQEERISLFNLYSLTTRIDDITGRKVWLKSGGNLVIDELEAMTVIDVNSAKITGKKSKEETFLQINLEACDEIAHQLIIRNLAGIIMVDFINMEEKEHENQMISYLKSLLKEDLIKATVVDITPLGIVEITRKRQQKTFKEQLGGYHEIH